MKQPSKPPLSVMRSIRWQPTSASCTISPFEWTNRQPPSMKWSSQPALSALARVITSRRWMRWMWWWQATRVATSLRHYRHCLVHRRLARTANYMYVAAIATSARRSWMGCTSSCLIALTRRTQPFVVASRRFCSKASISRWVAIAVNTVRHFRRYSLWKPRMLPQATNSA